MDLEDSPRDPGHWHCGPSHARTGEQKKAKGWVGRLLFYLVTVVDDR
jgi:hypothetical protein